jgi:hypothetical protein
MIRDYGLLNERSERPFNRPPENRRTGVGLNMKLDARKSMVG